MSFGLIAVLFVASGLVSLIYQVVWTRLLVLVFGSTTFATATVLAVFMGGLALGSFLAGRFSDRVKRPFLWYGILEGVIGLWALLVPALFDAAVPLYKAVWQQFHLSVVEFSLVRFVMATLILLLPTTCMGATLPLLAKFVTTSLDFVGRRVGTLYAANTLGAVGGAVWAGFVLLPACGLSATTIWAALINFALCGIVIIASHKLERPAPAGPPEPSVSDTGGDTGSGAAAPATALPLPVRLAVVSFALSGAVAMIYEVGWTRTLLMVIGSSTYAFTVMLSTFLIGIFLGSLVCARFVDRAREPLAWFAVLQLLLFVAGMASMYEFNYLPWWNLVINSMFPADPGRSLLVRFALAGAVFLPLTLCLGAIFPVVVKVATRDLERVGRSVGTLYSANTLGAIVGSFLSGFLLIPLFGVERMLVLAALANLVIGVGMLLFVERVRPWIKVAAVASLAPVIFWCVNAPDIWDRVVMLTAQLERRRIIRQPLMFRSFGEWRRDIAERFSCRLWKDGISSTVGVLQAKVGARQNSLVTNGHVDASDGVDMSTQILLGAYPLLWKPDASEVGVIGWGSGVTVGVCTLFPVEEVTAIELEPAVIDAAHMFDHVNHRPDKNPKVKLELNDGRNYLLATDKKFDVIISEPSNPWQAGVCNLFTQEYFQIVRRRLKPGGVFSFWLQTVEIPTGSLRQIFSALRQAFPYQTAVMANPGNLVVLASDQPMRLDIKKLNWLIANTPVASDLGPLGLRSGSAVCARIMNATDGVTKMAEGRPPNRDDRNDLEYAVARSYENQFYSGGNSRLIADSPGDLASCVATGDMKGGERAELFASIARESLLLGRATCAERWARASLAVAPSTEGLRVLGIALLEQGRSAEGFKLWADALALDPQHVETLQTRGMALLQAGRPEEARADFLKVIDQQPANPAALYHLAQTYSKMTAEPNPSSVVPDIALVAQPNQKPETVLSLLKGLVGKEDFVKRHPDVLYMAAVANYQLGKVGESEVLIRRFLTLAPRSVAGQRMLGTILYSNGRMAEASNWWFSSYALSKPAAQEAFRQAKELLSQGKEEAALDVFQKGIELWPGDPEVYSILKSMSRSNARAARMCASLKVIGYEYQKALVGGGR